MAVGCQHNDVSRVRIKLEDTAADRRVAMAKPLQPPPLCPAAGITPLQPGALGTGHHKVTLRWNASAPSNNADNAAVGYCLYRSKIRQAAKKNPICKDCEQVNRTPVPAPATKCIDDVVSDNTLYYYIVTAINSKSILSAPSNEIPVPIPAARTIKPSNQQKLLFCRTGLETH